MQSNKIAFKSIPENLGGGRVGLLLLLFALALYMFSTSGFSAFATICVIPIIVIYILLAFRYRMMTFWLLFVINYFLHFGFRTFYVPFPMSLPNEMFMLILLMMAIIDNKDLIAERYLNLMGVAIGVWCIFCTLEVLNDTCDIGIDIARWFMAARLWAFQLMYIFLVFSIYISNPKILHQYLFVWGCLTIYSACCVF